MKRLKIGVRLALAFGLVGLMLIVAAAMTATMIARLEDDLRATAERRLPNTIITGKLTTTVLETARDSRTVLLAEDQAMLAEVMASAKKTIALRADYFKYLDEHMKTPVARRQLEAVRAARQAYLPVETSYFELIGAGMKDEAKALLFERMRPAQHAYVAELEKLVDLQGSVATEGAASTVTAAETSLHRLLGGIAVMIVLLAVICWLTVRSIVLPLKRAVAISDCIADGELCNEVVVDRSDELGTLLGSLSRMQGNLASLVRSIQAKANDLTGASTELAATAEQVSAATNHQSQAASAMAASVEQMTVSVNHIADSAKLAGEKTTQSNALSEDGRRAVDSAGSEMSGIADSIRTSADMVAVLQGQSKEISSVAEAIKNIAEQTNLLALNAAIEAARAGEEGRGFAVVADAVRELAERTTRSTAEISATIAKVQHSTDQVFANMGESVERAASGLELSQRAGASIATLSGSSAAVLAAVQEISSALQEQGQAANDIARHVEGIAQMAEENSGAVEQTKHSALTLRHLAGDLQASVARFKV